MNNNELYGSLIFDLDGTLWNACEASAIGWTKALKALGIDKKITKEDIESVCGLTYQEIINQLFYDLEIDQIRLNETLNLYEQTEIKRLGGILFDSVLTKIPELKKYYKLFIVSNCQEWYLEAFLSHSGLQECFIDWESHGKTGKEKHENIKSIMQRNCLRNPVYIGDTPGDLNAAKKAGIDFYYAKYGYQNFIYSPASNSFDELGKYFLSAAQ